MATMTPDTERWYNLLLHPRVIVMLFLGFSAGIPILLIFSSLSLWLGEAGVERKAVTFFSWAALGYSFKFIWAPLVDSLPLPYLTCWLGRRRAWLLLSQVMIMFAIVGMASINPALGERQLVLMAWAAVLLGFSAATQDIVIDAYRIESAETRLQALMASSYVAGYRVGMVIAGAGALWLAATLGSQKGAYSYNAWQMTYLIMAATMLVGVLTTVFIAEPVANPLKRTHYPYGDYLRLVGVFACAVGAFLAVFFLTDSGLAQFKTNFKLGVLSSFILESGRFLLALFNALLVGWLLVRCGLVKRDMAQQAWVAPIQDFFQRYGMKTALLLLALVGLYRISDIVAGVISNVFYQDMGFTKEQIAFAVKTFGVFVTIMGGFLGGFMATYLGVVRTLFLGAIFAAFSNLVFVWLAYAGNDLTIMYFAVTADNLAAGFASAAFVAFLSALTNVSFTAMQYAIFSSLMTLIPKVLGGYAGTMVDSLGYAGFFTLTTVLGLPILVLIGIINRYVKVE